MMQTETIRLSLWIDNQIEGQGYDGTQDYIDATKWEAPEGVTLDDQQLEGDSEAVFAAFIDLAKRVEDVGHGDAEIDEKEPAPNLTACPEGLIEARYTSAAESLARSTSREHETYEDWAKAALFEKSA